MCLVLEHLIPTYPASGSDVHVVVSFELLVISGLPWGLSDPLSDVPSHT